MQREMISFNPNIPVEVILDYGPEGRLHEKTGNYQYTVNGNRNVMFLTPAARNQLARTTAQAGDTVRICKTVDGKSTLWRIAVVSDAAEVVPAPPPPQNGPRIVAPAQPRSNGANALAPDPSYPIVDRYRRIMTTSAQAAKLAHLEIISDPFWADLDKPTWEDIRAIGVHWAITQERREGK